MEHRNPGAQGRAEEPLEAFVAIQRGGLRAWVRRTHYEEVRDLGLLAEAFAPSGVPAAAGRGAALRLALPGGGRAVLRPYLRGGLPGRFVRDLFLEAGRALHELALHEALARRGVATVRALAARSLRVGGLWHRHWLLTEEVDGRDLPGALAGAGGGRPAILRAAGAAVARLHEAGFAHRDLHPRNLLVRQGRDGPEVLVLDLDRGRLLPRLPERLRLRSLVRMARYLVRHAGDLPEPVGARDALRFLSGYLGTKGPAVRGLYRRLEAELRRAVFWHGLSMRARRRGGYRERTMRGSRVRSSRV